MSAIADVLCYVQFVKVTQGLNSVNKIKGILYL